MGKALFPCWCDKLEISIMTHTRQTDAFFLPPWKSSPFRRSLIRNDMLTILRLPLQAAVIRGSPLDLVHYLGVLPCPDGLPTVDIS